MSRIVELGDLFNFKNGRSFKKTEWKEVGLPIIRIQNLNDVTAPFNYFDGDYDKAIEVNSGDLLFSWSGTVGSSFGPHIWMREKGVLNQHIFRLSKKQDINTQYAYYCLKNITRLIEQSVVGAVGIVHVTKKNIVKFKIPLPKITEQNRIVTKLDKAFEEIDKIIKLTEENKNNVEAIFENKVKEFFAIDKNHSDLINLSEVASYFNGLTYSPKDINDSGTIVLRSSNIQNGKMDFTDIVRVRKKISEKLYVRPNDILICSRNGSKRLIGKCSLIGKQKEQMTFGTFMMVIRSEANNYLKWFFKSKLFKQQISKGENSSINQITRYMLDEVLVPFPHKKTQVIISKKLKEIDSNVIRLIDIYEQKIIQLKKFKSSLLRQELQQENVA